MAIAPPDPANPPDPAKMLGYWEEWERGETPPGRVMANLKTAGMPQLLRQLAESGERPAG
ncbi:MAG TPA: hypothetical protein VID93_06495 [Acidimicrobiales bacterium]|jgi:hypothetical protein